MNRKKTTGPSNITTEMAGTKKYVRLKEGADRYSMGLHTFTELARDAKAVIKVKDVVLVDTRTFEEYLEAFREL